MSLPDQPVKYCGLAKVRPIDILPLCRARPSPPRLLAQRRQEASQSFLEVPRAVPRGIRYYYNSILLKPDALQKTYKKWDRKFPRSIRETPTAEKQRGHHREQKVCIPSTSVSSFARGFGGSVGNKTERLCEVWVAASHGDGRRCVDVGLLSL